MKQTFITLIFAGLALALGAPAWAQSSTATPQVVGAVPDTALLLRPFDTRDATLFATPEKAFYPETWFHYVNGNVDRQGITSDLEAIARAGLAGVQFFHGGGFSDGWKGVTEPVYCLSDKWRSLVQHTASEARRLGLRFTMQNCPGWAMSGGPWIDHQHAMRHLAFSRTDVEAGQSGVQLPIAPGAEHPNRDYRDLMVLAFPTPLGDTGEALYSGRFRFGPATPDKPNVIDIRLERNQVARTLELSSINGFNHSFCTDPAIDIRVLAIDASGHAHCVLDAAMPASNWQDEHTISLALAEQPGCKHYRVEILNRHDMNLPQLRLLSVARKQNWEGEAAWTLRSMMQEQASARQNPLAYVGQGAVIDLTDQMDAQGHLAWQAPQGRYTVLRIGHVNTLRRNSPAPPEATGWECDKLSPAGAELHFAHYIGSLAAGPVRGLMSNMLMDSWECYSQTWTPRMADEFRHTAGYSLSEWMPALFGYVIGNPDLTGRFLNDWRRTLNRLYVDNYFGRMAALAHEQGLTCTYETAGGDITPADPMEYYKHADVPMCEFWQPFSNFLYNRNFKPIRPTVSAARMYGKPRVSAESFTSFVLTWDEHWQMLRDVANQNMLHGLTHLVFHTYTHNPGATKYFPGTSFGSNIGSPFLRGQTWWRHMPSFTGYLARCTYMLERGRPVSSVLWYVGDEYQQKPDQFFPFPAGYKYDYCNPDALLTRLTVRDGLWITPEGISYSVMWMPQPGRMMPHTLERLVELVKAGGTLLAEPPTGMATLCEGNGEAERYRKAVEALWPADGRSQNALGQGRVYRGMPIEDVLRQCGQLPDVCGLGEQWLHRHTEGADWYFVCAPQQQAFSGQVEFRATGRAELWDPVHGTARVLPSVQSNGVSTVQLDLAVGQSQFVVFRHDAPAVAPAERQVVVCDTLAATPWSISFPQGWGIDSNVFTTELRSWHQLLPTPEGRAFSGTATYRTTFHLPRLHRHARYTLGLGHVEMIAVVRVNGQEISTLWTEPYQADITHALRRGENQLEIEVTSSWHNRLAYDAQLPEPERKTWVIAGPGKDSPLRPCGLLGPVTLVAERE